MSMFTCLCINPTDPSLPHLTASGLKIACDVSLSSSSPWIHHSWFRDTRRGRFGEERSCGPSIRSSSFSQDSSYFSTFTSYNASIAGGSTNMVGNLGGASADDLGPDLKGAGVDSGTRVGYWRKRPGWDISASLIPPN